MNFKFVSEFTAVFWYYGARGAIKRMVPGNRCTTIQSDSGPLTVQYVIPATLYYFERR